VTPPQEALLYHHCRPIERVSFGTVYPANAWSGNPDLLHGHDQIAYAWLAERCGFWPIWLAVGITDDDRRVTGYSGQWLRKIGDGPDPSHRIYVRRGEFPSFVLFSWTEAPPRIVHIDYDTWHIVLNSVEYEDRRPARLGPIGPGTEASIMRPSWTPARWRRYARTHPASVQAVAPALDLASADAVWCRSQAARRRLIAMGFPAERIEVRRIAVDRC